MKHIYYIPLLFIAACLLTWTGCSDSGTGPSLDDLTGESSVFEFTAVGESGIGGKVTFAERVDGFTRVKVELTNASEEEEYLVKIYSNTVLKGGELLIKLNAVEGSAGESVTVVSTDEDGETVTYEDLTGIDAHIAIHPEDDAETILATADIGQNAFTGESLSFSIDEKNESGIEGTIKFFERENGRILAIIELSGTETGNTHPARLYTSEENNDGEPIIIFNAIDGDSGISLTDISQLEDETSFTFEDLQELDGFVNVYLSEENMEVAASSQISQDED